ncbi:MAG: ribosomal-processing cysteine protease Prp [Bacillota bacterium]
MVFVEFFEDRDELLKAFKFTGHAGAAPHGEDLVCSAISVLSQTAVIGLQYYLREKPKLEIAAGLLSCILPDGLNELEQERSQTILKTMELGLKALQPKYGNYFELHRRRWTECL